MPISTASHKFELHNQEQPPFFSINHKLFIYDSPHTSHSILSDLWYTILTTSYFQRIKPLVSKLRNKLATMRKLNAKKNGDANHCHQHCQLILALRAFSYLFLLQERVNYKSKKEPYRTWPSTVYIYPIECMWPCPRVYAGSLSISCLFIHAVTTSWVWAEPEPRGGSGLKSLTIIYVYFLPIYVFHIHFHTLSWMILKWRTTTRTQTVTRSLFFGSKLSNIYPHPLIQVGQCQKAGRQGPNHYYFQTLAKCQWNSYEAWNNVYNSGGST